jgi:hypothetical protein
VSQHSDGFAWVGPRDDCANLVALAGDIEPLLQPGVVDGRTPDCPTGYPMINQEILGVRMGTSPPQLAPVMSPHWILPRIHDMRWEPIHPIEFMGRSRDIVHSRGVHKGQRMKTTMILTVSMLVLVGCHNVRTGSTALTADDKGWPICSEWIDSLEFDNKTVKVGELICANDEATVDRIVAARKSSAGASGRSGPAFVRLSPKE